MDEPTSSHSVEAPGATTPVLVQFGPPSAGLGPGQEGMDLPSQSPRIVQPESIVPLLRVEFQ